MFNVTGLILISIISVLAVIRLVEDDLCCGAIK